MTPRPLRLQHGIKFWIDAAVSGALELASEGARVAGLETQGLGNGHAANGQGVAITSPLPKRAVDYQLPEGTSLDAAQALLARNLEEARA